ncbi:phosphoglycerate mutase-like protein [Daldinia loculata]|uniref:phosphoglycerate mutase-like protein n=1 Tax=Daldinia loculata TaxID=103429 RepID=UPI0020C33C50|nr:phosphoglycerate mutase-like protein [Daldinia loculata]KAI1648953.1 phosphoglycerate mutase-like protein [Daldinia loculata]
MLATDFFIFLSLSSACLGWEWESSGKLDQKQRNTCRGADSTVKYTTISGFFQQDDPTTDSKSFDYTETNYGLINRSYPTDGVFDPKRMKTQWERFTYYVDSLNGDCDGSTQYKVLFMARHGEGYHNTAESYYGTPAWNCYWGPLEGNGTAIWRDAQLTEAGIAQCTKANNFWKRALAVEKIPAPQSYYSSPLIRSATTANLTFNGLEVPVDRPFAPTIKEFLREGISMRTCDERSNKTYIQTLLPAFRFEDGFTEDDELWKGYEGETSEAQIKRTKIVLDDIFSSDDSTWISITSHSGQIRANLQVLGHIEFSLSTGQAIPALVKAVTLREVEPSTTTIESWIAEATCSLPPVTSISGQGCVCSSASASSAAFTTTAIPT